MTQGISVFPQRDIGYPEDKTGSSCWKLKTNSVFQRKTVVGSNSQILFFKEKQVFPKVSLTQWNFAMSGTGTLVNQ